MKKILNKQWSIECKKCIRMVLLPDLAEEYIREAEHQDGEGYWMQFETVSDVLTDAKLYRGGLDEYSLVIKHTLDLINNDCADIIVNAENQSDDVKKKFKEGLRIINKTFEHLYK